MTRNYFGLGAFLLCFLFILPSASAQRSEIKNMDDHDDKPFYFGLSFGINSSTYKIRQSEAFTLTDSIKSIQAGWGPGFHIGLMGSLMINKYIDVRFVPTITFAEKHLIVGSKSNIIQDKTMESIYTQFPLQAKFKSDRMGNFRFYGLLGARFDYDLASNARSRKSDELIRVKPIDISSEIGFGLEFHYPNFILAPEIKISQGFLNEHQPDQTIFLSNMIDRISTRMVTFSLLIQG